MNRVDFLLDADELAPVIRALQEALTRRPNPEGEPHFDLQTALDSCDEYFQSIRELTEATGRHSDGNQTCSTAHRTLTVTPKNQALITLSWYPQSGAAPVPFQGPDVGLHVLHPNASGEDLDHDGTPDGWYDTEWDCHWGNPMPPKEKWGSASAEIDDTVTLIAESGDGLGPDAVRVGMYCAGPPNKDRVYRIGAHFWGAAGTGPAQVFVHIWNGQGGGATTQQILEENDLWEAATLKCPSGEISIPTTPKIIKNVVY